MKAQIIQNIAMDDLSADAIEALRSDGYFSTSLKELDNLIVMKNS